MTILEFIVLAIGLCFDTLAVSIVAGPFIKTRKVPSYIYFSSMLAIVQAAFILAGLFSGKAVVDFLGNFAHWIAFAMLLFLGVRMILQKEEEESNAQANVMKFSFLLVSGIATSIDALFVGFALGLEISGADMWILPLVVYIVTALTSIFGLSLGYMLSRWSSKFNILGGSILILIGLRILITALLGN